MARDPIDVFRQLGLREGEDCLTLTLSGQFGTSVAEVRDAATGLAPTSGSDRFLIRLINPEAEGHRFWLELRDAPLADAAALVVADGNMFITNDGDQAPEPLTFTLRDTCFVNPFADDQYCEWVAERDARGVWVLDDPRREYGEAYERWAESLLLMADRGELGPLVASAHAAYVAAPAAPTR